MEKVFGIVFEAEERFGGDAEEESVTFSPITKGAEKGEDEAEEGESEGTMSAEPVHWGLRVRGRLGFGVGLFEDGENFFEGGPELGGIGDIDREAGVIILAGDHVAIGEEDIGEFEAVVASGDDIEGAEVWGAEEEVIDDESADGDRLAIVAEIG